MGTGILTRFVDIMSANVNAFMENLEGRNADKLLEKYIMDAQKDLGQVKAQTAGVMAAEKQALRRLEDCSAEIEKYERYALSAVQEGKDTDARKFLAYKRELEEKRMSLEQAYQDARENSSKMRQMTEKLGGNIHQATSRLNELRSKVTMAKSQEKLNEIGGKMGDMSALEETVQRRLDTAEAMAELNRPTDAEQELEKLMSKYDCPSESEEQTSLEEELQALKKRAGK